MSSVLVFTQNLAVSRNLSHINDQVLKNNLQSSQNVKCKGDQDPDEEFLSSKLQNKRKQTPQLKGTTLENLMGGQKISDFVRKYNDGQLDNQNKKQLRLKSPQQSSFLQNQSLQKSENELYNGPKTAYTHISEKIKKDIDSQLQSPKGRLEFKEKYLSADKFPIQRVLIENERFIVKNQGDQQKQLSEKLHSEIFSKHDNLMRLRELKMAKEQQELTFQPKINSSKQDKPLGGDVFYTSIMQRANQVKQKIQMQQYQQQLFDDVQNTGKPQIRAITDKIAQNKFKRLGCSPDAHKRLYELNKRTQRVRDQQSMNNNDFFSQEQASLNENYFSPKINEKSKNIQRSSESLYQDALLRQSKSLDHLDDNQQQKQQMSIQSQLQAENKFIKEFKNILQNVSQDQKIIYFEQFLDIMINMGYYQPEKQDKTVMEEIWYILVDKLIYDYIHARNLLVFLLAIHNFGSVLQVPLINYKSHSQTMIDQSQQNNPSYIPVQFQKPHNQFDELGNWNLNNQDVNEIRKKYSFLVNIRLQKNLKSKYQQSEELYPFSPKISDTSQKLASQKKER